MVGKQNADIANSAGYRATNGRRHGNHFCISIWVYVGAMEL